LTSLEVVPAGVEGTVPEDVGMGLKVEVWVEGVAEVEVWVEGVAEVEVWVEGVAEVEVWVEGGRGAVLACGGIMKGMKLVVPGAVIGLV
jgi:hypothetical protein